MARKTALSGFSAAISSALNEYSGYVTAETKKAVKKAGKEAVQKLKQNSPRDSGNYAKSWKASTSETKTILYHPCDGIRRKSPAQPYSSAGKRPCQARRRPGSCD